MSITKSKNYLHQHLKRFFTGHPPVNLGYKEYDTESHYDKPPILVLHGVMACKRNWHGVCGKLHDETRPKRKVIALDARNHGSSPHTAEHSYPLMSADLLKFMEDHRIPQATLLGHSMGGRTALYTALNNPEYVERVISVDITPFDTHSELSSMQPLFDAMKQLIIPKGTPLNEGRDIARAKLSDIFPHAATINFMLMNLRRENDGRYNWCVNFDALAKNYKDFSHFPIENLEGYRFDRPAMVLGAKRAGFVTLSQIDGMKKYFPKLNVKFFDTGHTIHAERPDEFVETVLNFVND